MLSDNGSGLYGCTLAFYKRKKKKKLNGRNGICKEKNTVIKIEE